MLTNLSNEIPLIPDWDPSTLHHPIQKEVPPPKFKEGNIPLGKAKPMAVSIPTTSLGRGDCFIDDVVKVFLSRPGNIKRHAQSALLTIFMSMRPHAGEKEPVFRRDPIFLSKLEAKSRPKEEQPVLGWDLDAHGLLLRLPNDKFVAYSTDIRKILDKNLVTEKLLDSIIGQLNHSSYVIPLSRHFFSRLRSKLQKIKTTPFSRFRSWQLQKEEREKI